MNYLVFIIIALGTILITQFAASQIIGIILFMLPMKKYNTIAGLIIWSSVLVGLYFVINKWFENYYQVYLWSSIIAIVISLINVKNLKSEIN